MRRDNYSRLSQSEIWDISTMREAKVPIEDIAKKLKRHIHTVTDCIKEVMPPEFHPKPHWKRSPETVEAMRIAWAKGDSASTIGEAMGVSKNVVIGLAYRMKFERHPSVQAESRRRQAQRASANQRGRRKEPRPYAIGNAPPKPITRRDMAEALKPEPYLILPDEPPLIHRLVDLEDNHCRWPIGDPQQDGESFGFCGKVRFNSTFAYCATHARRAFHLPGHPPPEPAEQKPAAKEKVYVEAAE